ncbi:MAG: apocytochrome f [Microcoleaceae cyanobacterium]
MSKIDRSAMWETIGKAIAKTMVVAIATIGLFLTSDIIHPQAASAYPFWAQETAPETPRDPTGRLACANCHLGAKPTEVEVPQSVLPDTVFKAIVKIPYDTSAEQVLGDGSKGGLNVGAVLMLPEGFKIAPEDRIPEEWEEEVSGLYFQPYAEDQENVVLVGPIPGEEYQEIVFPVLSPDPATDKSINFGKYAVHVGGNRGRGQVYPAGNKSNNSVYNASVSGTITDITFEEYVGNQISIETADGETIVDTVPPGPELLVTQGDTVEAGQVITNDPNVGGFGQADGEIVLQDANRIKWLIAFFALVMLAQILLVLKKKQVEKVQAAEMNF